MADRDVMIQLAKTLHRLRRTGLWLLSLAVLAGSIACARRYQKTTGGSVQRTLPGGHAGTLDQALLTSVHEITTERPPAAIRPDVLRLPPSH